MKTNGTKKRIDYRHIVCGIITLGMMFCVLMFPAAIGRIIESGRDLGLSAAYYFCGLFGVPYSFSPTVNEISAYPSSPVFLPETWQGFQEKWAEYWQLWANTDNFIGYLSSLGGGLYIFAYVLIVAVPFFLIVFLLFRFYLNRQNNDYGKESKPLRIFKKISACTYRPVKKWLKGFFSFIKEHKSYWVFWLCLWLFYFNAFTIVLEFFAYYFYFVMSFDIASLYIQVYKLVVDLSAVIAFFPWWAWIAIVLAVLYFLSLSAGYKRLNHNERRNRGFLNERGVVNCVYGYVGAGKTALVTDMALSEEVQILDDAFEVILETDMRFPYFPWINFENELKRAAYYHVVYDIWSCRRWVRKKRERFLKSPCTERIFGYDYILYGLDYDDKLKLTDIWKALEDYACAYFIYTVQSSYIIGTYSVRSDKLISDIGNFPVWNTDFFRRDSRLIDSFSRHSHILDFDMLRLGKKMLEDNPNRNAFGFGVYTISEIDKERKNAPELQGTEKKAAECNQKNDLFNACLKISRHSCVIANRVFLKVLSDLQRTGSLNSDMLELGDEIEVQGKTEMLPVLPFYSPFWALDLLFGKIADKFYDFYLKYRFNRSDTTLFLYIVKTIVSKMVQYRERIMNTFGCQTLKLKVARGLDNGESKEYKWYRQSKKIFSKRYSTDCLSGIFESRGNLNAVGIDDLKEYADIMATNDELLEQHSHFQNEINALYQG